MVEGQEDAKKTEKETMADDLNICQPNKSTQSNPKNPDKHHNKKLYLIYSTPKWKQFYKTK